MKRLLSSRMRRGDRRGKPRTLNLSLRRALKSQLGVEPLEGRMLLAGIPNLLADLVPGDGSSFSRDFTDVDGTTFFVADDDVHGAELWKSDGTEEGTVLVKNIRPDGEDGSPVGSYPTDLTDVAGTLFFTVESDLGGIGLWKSDGTEAGTVLVKDFAEGSLGGYPGGPPQSNLTDVAGTLFLTADDGINGTELWKSDGTEAGTVMVKDINPGESYGDPRSSNPTNLTEVSGTLFFTASDTEHGVELWKSDGTEAGTVLVKDINPDTIDDYAYSGLPWYLTNVNGTLFFTANDGEHGVELWKSDGTEAGTSLVRDISLGDEYAPYSNSTDPRQLTAVDGTLFFTADDGETGLELWKSDGTESGTVLVKDIRPGVGDFYFDDGYYDYGYRYGPYPSTPEKLTSVSRTEGGGLLFFTADDGENGLALWRSDGTADGTEMVADLRPGDFGGAPDSSYPDYLTAGDGILFFVADADTNTGRELWQTDGTEDGTVAVGDIFPGESGSDPRYLAYNNGTLFFAADDGDNGSEPWVFTPTDELPGSVIRGSVFFDNNGNGVRDGDEPGRPEYPVYVDQNDNGRFDAGELITTTDVLGDYQITVEPGVYVIRSPGISGFVQSTPLDPDSHTAATDAPGSLLDLDFGFRVVAPSAIDLAPNSDSGAADDDDITSFNNAAPESVLDFVVTGADDGAEVRLFADDALIGTGILLGGTVTITTDGSTAFADGQRSITATQVIGGFESMPSPALVLTVDASAPAGFVSTPPDTARADELYTYDANSPDESLPGMTVSLADAPDGMTIDQDGVVRWTPDIGDQGIHSYEVRITDVAGNTSSQPVQLTVLGVIPARPNRYILDEGQPLQVDTASGVLGNDGDDPSGSLTSTVVTEPSNGTLELNDDGSFTYTPNPGFSGSDQFTYRASDGVGQSNEAPVTLIVMALNDRPIAVDDPYEIPEDNVLTVSAADGVLRNDSDADGDPITAERISQPANGSLTFNADGSFTYTPNANFFGTDTFQYRANDGTGDSEIATVTITVQSVNDLPIVADDEYTVDEDEVLTVDALDGVLGNDSDVDGELTATIVDDPGSGTVSFNGDGSFRYTPDLDFFGTDTFTYRASDGTDDSRIVTVTISVTATADPPTANDDAIEVENTGETHVIDVLNNDTVLPDAAQPLTIIAVTQGTGGGVVEISMDGSEIEYTPATTDFTDTETFTYTIEDGDGLMDEATVTVTVTEPGSNTISGFVYIDANRDGMRDDGEAGVPGSMITLRSTDTAGQTLTFTVLTDDDGSYSFQELPSRTFEIVQHAPEAMVDGLESLGSAGGDADEDRFTNVALSGRQTGSNYNFAELGLRAQYISTRMYLASAPPMHELLRDIVADGEARTGNLELADAIRAGGSDAPPDTTNQAPSAADDSFDVTEDDVLTVAVGAGVLRNDTDPDGDSLMALVVNGPENGTLELNDDGSFTYTPNSDFSGTDFFTYQAGDGTLSSGAARATITVGGINDAPIGVDDSYSVLANGSLNIDEEEGVLANDVDADDDLLEAILVEDVQNGRLILDEEGSFLYTPDADFVGADTFTYRADDGDETSDVATVTFTVRTDNVAPVASDDAYSTDEDVTLTVDALFGLLGNDEDDDGDSLDALLSDGPDHGRLTLQLDGSFQYEPDPNFEGFDSFTYRASDGLAESNTVEVTIVVDPVNDAPVAARDEYSVTSGEVLIVEADDGVLDNDTDVDGDSLTASIVDRPDDGTVTFNTDGSFRYTPDGGFFGSDSFTYRAHDGAVDSALQTVQIDVAAPTGDPDLVQFAMALADSGTIFYGAAWCPHCTATKEVFEDGAHFLPFVEVTNPDRTPLPIAFEEEISSFPTWEFPDGTRLEGETDLHTLSRRSGVAIPLSNRPFFAPIDETVLLSGSPLHIPLDGYDPNGGPLRYSVTSVNPLVETTILKDNRSLTITAGSYGNMVFELFDGRAPRVTEQITALADIGFYEGVIFHRILNDFVVQGGDPTGSGSGGSQLGDFDDQFHVDLQHNRTGVLSMAKTTDDTNDSQFFIVEDPARHLDFNHSIFGQLVEGFDVFASISDVPTEAGGRPLDTLAMRNVRVFDDEENAMLMLKAPDGTTGEANITVTVEDEDGFVFERTFRVTMRPDTTNGGPFLSDIPDVQTDINTPITFQLVANDVEGDAVRFDGLGPGPVDFDFEVDETSGEVMVTPPTDFAGTLELTVRVRPQTSSGTSDLYDSQTVRIKVNS